MDGGGGQGVLCEANGQRTLELLDLYEAKNIWGLAIPKSRDQRSEVRRIIPNYLLYSDNGLNGERIQPPPPPTEEDVDSFIKYFREQFMPRLRPIPQGSRLNLSSDFTQPIIQLPGNCRYVQIIFYVDENIYEGQILVDQEYWNLLTPQDQIALELHEILYKELRAFGEKDSYRTRRVTGLIFGEEKYPGLIKSSYGQTDPLLCSADFENGYFSFLVVRHWDEWAKREIGRILFLATNTGGVRERRLLVETVSDFWFPFEYWKNWSFDSKQFSGGDFFANSALGSRVGRITFKNRECGPSGKKCQLKMELLTDEDRWVGGDIRCRPWRKP